MTRLLLILLFAAAACTPEPPDLPGSGTPSLPTTGPVVRLSGLAPVLGEVIARGGLDTTRLRLALARAGAPLTAKQETVLQGDDAPLAVAPENAAFLLYTLWPTGLVNRNPVLTAGPMATRSRGAVGRFASVGGWHLGRRGATAVYARAEIIDLTADEQTRLETVARLVYRPCCDNSTYFPDCNHGMAMLGMLSLLADQGASMESMLTAAEALTAIWYPEAIAHARAVLRENGVDTVPGIVVGQALMSARGHRRVRETMDRTSPAGGRSSLAC